MKRSYAGFFLLPLVPILLTGCSSIGDKAASISIVYGATAVLSLLLLVGYCSMSPKREIWHLLLFASVYIVNTGYFALAISRSLDEALLANRLSYLGSVFLPLSMWMIITRTTHIRYVRWLPGMLLGLAVVVFLIAATPGYLPIYYREVSFEKVNGVSTLVKVYGPLHVLYLIYLLGYFTAMVATIVHATVKDKIDSLAHATVLAVAVFVNIGVWLIEQLVRIDFEILSVSYIISECFLLGLHLLIVEAEKQKASLAQQMLQESQVEIPAVSLPMPEAEPSEPDIPEELSVFLAGIPNLTPKERELFSCYIAGMTTDLIMEQLCIKENTLKFHSKNLYSKLGVRSRKQLAELYRIASEKELLPQ